MNNSVKKPLSSNSMELLSAAPLVDEWNKENVPMMEQQTSGMAPLPFSSPKGLILKGGGTFLASSSSSLSKPGSSSKCKGPLPRPPLFCMDNSIKSAPASPSPSQCNLLKRPLLQSPVTDSGGSSFTIKRRRGLALERSLSMSVADLDKKQREGMCGVGASPVLGAEEDSPASRRLLLTTSCSSSPSTPLRRRPYGPPPSSRPSAPALHRSLSANHAAQVKRSFDLGDRNPNLTGDTQMELCLPTLKTQLKHPDLRTIDVHTMAKLIRGEFAHVVSNYRILDARYAYEFEGGHIRGAENYGLWDEKAFFDEFLPTEPKQLSSLSPSTSCPPSSASSGFSTDVIMSVIEEMDEEQSPSHDPVVVEPKQDHQEQDKAVGPKRNILIFHCEFSSARGPALMKELRKRDRTLNKNTYPALYHPEIYLLHNGYKEFYENYPELCTPRSYRPMKDPQYSQEEKLFRKKSKSWAAGGGSTVARVVGNSSRLLKL